MENDPVFIFLKNKLLILIVIGIVFLIGIIYMIIETSLDEILGDRKKRSKNKKNGKKTSE